MRQTIVELIR